jgi:hypothetical protein
LYEEKSLINQIYYNEKSKEIQVSIRLIIKQEKNYIIKILNGIFFFNDIGKMLNKKIRRFFKLISIQ